MLVLSGCGISRAGEQAEIAAFCAHVVELDLSHNKLQDWLQVSPLTQQRFPSFLVSFQLFSTTAIVCRSVKSCPASPTWSF